MPRRDIAAVIDDMLCVENIKVDCAAASVKLSIGTVKGCDTDPRCGCLRLLPPAVEVLVSACV